MTRAFPGIVRVTLTVGYTLTRGTSVCMADDPWLTGDCQSNSDGQRYSDNRYLSMHICDIPGIGMNCQSYNGPFIQILYDSPSIVVDCQIYYALFRQTVI